MPEDTDQLARLKAALAERYRVERELGHGGMATVWLAHDLKHDRPVALKVLRPELAAVLGPERFLREVRITARLNHPHILPLLDSGEADGFVYYTMPYVEGESLRERLAREKQLPLDDAMQMAREVADALSYAHSHDVVHRDIKPENILLQSGHAVVADFGIARAITAAGGERLTETGIAMGTPAYMSPEQAAGSKELDGRSDLYSLGCLLYEMLAGRPPFVGPTLESIVHQHLAAVPPSVTSIRPSAPAAVGAALDRALAKTAADRFTTVTQFAEAVAPRVSLTESGTTSKSTAGHLWRWVAGVALTVSVTGAVLGLFVFRDRHSVAASPRPYTVVAVVEGSAAADVRSVVRRLIATELDRSGVVQVLPDAQVALGLTKAGLPDTMTLAPAAAQELAVRGRIPTVVVGSLERLGSAFSLSIRVLHASGDTTIAIAAADAASEDALIQAVERAVRMLRAQLGERPRAIAQTRPLQFVATPSYAAFRRYDQAQELYRVGDWSGASRLYREALALDPGFASAWIGLGKVSWNMDSLDVAAQALDSTLAHANRLDDAELLYVNGMRAYLGGDLPGAVEALTRLAREHGQRQPLSLVLDDLGRTAEAVDLMREQERSDPFGLPLSGRYVLTVWLATLGRYQEAWAFADSFRMGAPQTMELAAEAGDWTRAESLAATVLRESRNPRVLTIAPTITAGVLAARGRVRESLTWLRQLPRAPVGLFAILMLHQASGLPLPAGMLAQFQRDTSGGVMTATALWATASDDTGLARRSLTRVRARPPEARWQLNAALDLADAWLTASGEQPDEAARRFGPLAGRPSFAGPPINQLSRWLAADAYERAGQLDSAAVWFERIAGWREFWSNDRGLRGLTHCFAHQRLVVLYARMGRLDDARRHWKILSETVTQPDPEVAHLMEEARTALEEASRTMH